MEGAGFSRRLGLGFGVKAFWTAGTVVLVTLFVVTSIDQVARSRWELASCSVSAPESP